MRRNLLQTLAAALGLVAGAERGLAEDKKQPELPVKEFELPPGYVQRIAFSPDSTKMAAGVDTSLIVWNISDGKEITRARVPEKQIYHRFVFAKDGKTIVWTGREDPLVRIFDTASGRQLREFHQPDLYKEKREAAREAEEIRRKNPNFAKEKGGGYAFSSQLLCISPDGERMAFSGKNGVEILDVATGKITVEFRVDTWHAYSFFSPDGKILALHVNVKGDEKQARFYDTATGALVNTLTFAGSLVKGSNFSQMSFSPDGTRLATGGSYQTADERWHNSLDIWDYKSGKRLCTVPAWTYHHGAAFSRDNKSILCANADSQFVLHNLIMEKSVHVFGRAEPGGGAATFTPDGKKLAIVSQRPNTSAYHFGIRLYDIPAQLFDPPAARIDDAELSKLWVEFKSDNQLRLDLAIKAYRAAPKDAVAVIRKELRPVAKERQEQVEARIAALDDDDYRRRDSAMEELQGVAHEFAPLLESRRASAGPSETRNRLHFVLKKMGAEKTPMPLVGETRAVRFLAELATPEARQLLTDFAAGAAGARLTVEARTALDRLREKQ